MDLPNWLDLAHHVGFAAAIYVAIRADLKHLMKSAEDHESRLRKLEHSHG